MPELERNLILQLDDEGLSRRCEIAFFKGSGPGGQHRNKTSTAVRVTLSDAPEFSASDCTERSQLRNRSNALRKLRVQIALSQRSDTPLEVTAATLQGLLPCAITHARYPLFMACLLDLLTQVNFDRKAAAERLNLSPSALLKLLHKDAVLWQKCNEERQKRGLFLWKNVD